MPADVIVAGHICLDLSPALPGPVSIEPGRLVEVGPVALSTGGAVGNTGMALHRLGVPVRMMGKIGDDAFGRAVLELLDERGPGLSAGMVLAPGEATSYSVVLDPPGVDRSFLHCPGANDTFSAADVHADALAGARIFHFGYPPIMRAMYADGGEQLAQMFGAVSAAGLVTSLDLCRPDPASAGGRVDWAALLARVLPAVDLFHPSVDELREVLGIAGDVDRALLASLGARLVELGVAVAVIKLGEAGIYVRTSADEERVGALCTRLGLDVGDWVDRELLVPCFAPRRVAGTTGAGDCAIAGFLGALLRGEGPDDAATAAAAVGACSVEADDATSGVPPWPQIAARIGQGWARTGSALAGASR